jgi:hypothetical protein
MMYCLRKQGATLFEFKTDSVLYRPLKRPRPTLPTLAIRDLGDLRERFEPGGLRFERRCDVPTADSSELASKVHAATEKDLLKFAPRKPQRALATEHQCGRGVASAWRGLTPEAARERVVNGESLLCLGIAGAGKTHFVAELAALLRAQGLRVEAISKTHVARGRRDGGPLGQEARPPRLLQRRRARGRRDLAARLRPALTAQQAHADGRAVFAQRGFQQVPADRGQLARVRGAGRGVGGLKPAADSRGRQSDGADGVPARGRSALRLLQLPGPRRAEGRRPAGPVRRRGEGRRGEPSASRDRRAGIWSSATRGASA